MCLNGWAQRVTNIAQPDATFCSIWSVSTVQAGLSVQILRVNYKIHVRLTTVKPTIDRCESAQHRLIRPWGYKTFFMLNSAKHEICAANKSQITNNCKFFLAKHAEHENFSANKYENANYCWHFHI